MSFFGDYRRKPEQSLRGNSKNLAREQLIQQAALERRQRQEHKRQIDSAKLIQSVIRGFMIRRKLCNIYRAEFDAMRTELSSDKQPFDGNLFGQLIRRLLFFYSRGQDGERLTWTSQGLLTSRNTIVTLLLKDTSSWLYRIKSILHLNVLTLLEKESGQFNLPMRLIEVFTAEETYLSVCSLLNTTQILSAIWTFLAEKHFYTSMRHIVDTKIPEPMAETSRSKTAIGESILSLAARPLHLKNTGDEFQRVIVKSLLAELLHSPFSPQVKLLAIPFITEHHPPAFSVLHSVIATRIAEENLTETNPQQTLAILYVTIKIARAHGKALATPSSSSSSSSSFSSSSDISHLLQILKLITPGIANFMISNAKLQLDIEEDETERGEGADGELDDEDAEMLTPEEREYQLLSKEILAELNEGHLVNLILSQIDSCDRDSEMEIFSCVSAICYSMLFSRKLAVHEFRILYTLAFKPKFIRNLWRYVTSARADPSLLLFGSSATLLQLICRGLPLASVDWKNILPQLTLFCSLWSYQLQTLDEVEFYESDEENFFTQRPVSSSPSASSSSTSVPLGGSTKKSTMPFTLKELAEMCLILRDVCIGLIELAYTDSRTNISADYSRAMQSVRPRGQPESRLEREQVASWQKLFKAATILLRQLQARDSRRRYCPDGHWISRHVAVSAEYSHNIASGLKQRRRYEVFRGLRFLTREQLEMEGPPPTATEVRNVTILQEIPFVVPFTDRVKIIHNMLDRDKNETRAERHNFLVPGSSIQVMIRRNYIYEDSFEKLSPENEPNMKLPIRVNFINSVGLDEAGIDGGGVFREFLSELLRRAFNPEMGLFIYTQDKHLYPNPSVAHLYENYTAHYEFVGRMLGKALYENMLIEIPLAPFFLVKLLSKTSTSDIDIHHLSSMDPVVYRNLLYLKNYDGNVAELGLDFTTVITDFGANKVIPLKPDGSNIPVTGTNRIEYIHLIADYKLNKQIRAQCSAFKAGLSSLIDLEYIRMFDPNELQILISGAPTPIDIDDLKVHTNYGGGYHADHPVIVKFWRVLAGFHNEQRSKLLRFVTSCSRAPLLGFRNLHPSFAIQNAGRDPERLPTASTCMNLLKLPEIDDEELLKKKLLYAVEAGSGFELS